jgi:hypothetical protein
MFTTTAKKCKLNKTGRNKHERSWNKLYVLHHNIRTLSGKCTELGVLLETDVKNADVLCFTRHWLKSQKLHGTNIYHYMVAITFCRTNNSKHGGSCYVQKDVVNILRSTYFANFHSHVRYGILFWGVHAQRVHSLHRHKASICNVIQFFTQGCQDSFSARPCNQICTVSCR